MPARRPTSCFVHPGTILLFRLVAGFVLLALAAESAVSDDIDFDRDIRPILSENCAFCHGPDEATREADLRLDTPEGTWAVVEKEHSEESELFRRITSSDVDELMPPPDSNRRLSKNQIELIRSWIDRGAKWEQHWSFQPLIASAVPEVQPGGDAAIRNPIDAFVQSRLAEHGLRPSPEASRTTLIRRLSLDLTGLPPTPEQVDAFVADQRPDAYERLVERLLSSPAYGQRMAWDWLDAARYADTNGYQGDRERTMWPWRDWVVDAFNDNLPYDQFTLWQLAGDLLPDATLEQQLATGFCRNHMINGEGGRIAEENRVEYVMDMSETMGTVWLGLTLNCCRCHDHKYDPITNAEYYQLFAFFNQTPVDGAGGDPQTPPILPTPTPEQAAALASINNQIASLEARIREISLSRASEQAAPEPQGDEQRKSSHGAHRDSAPPDTTLRDRRDKLVKERDALEKSFPKVMVMADVADPRKTFILNRGLYNQPTDEVSASLPAFLPPTRDENDPRLPNRLTLARWLVDPQNPLTARVTVNRFWQQVFGIGLVKTTEDFGAQGEIPIHRDLLNWMASRFQEDHWDVKKLMRLIVTSHTYRQSSKISDPAAQELDPDNRLLARNSRYRLPSWMLRDQALAASGLLSTTKGGPAVNTYQPAGIWEEASFGKKAYTQDAGEKLFRRSLYTFWRRIIAPTMFFDNASRQTCTVKFSRTNTPLQTLQTLNNVTYVEAARVLAEKVLTADLGSDADRIDFVMRRTVARRARDAEQSILLAGLARARQQFAAEQENASQLASVGDSPRDQSLDPVEHAAWTSLCLAILNLDETLNRE